MSVKTYSMATQKNLALSANFHVREFACKDGSDKVLIDDALVSVLQKVRTHFNKAVTINSAYRTSSYNKKVDGSSNSQHCKGTAADIVVKDLGVIDYKKAWDSCFFVYCVFTRICGQGRNWLLLQG